MKKNKIFNFLIVIFLFPFLFFNLISSQSVSPLYFQLVNDDKKAAIEYLKKIRFFPEFNQELVKQKKIYGQEIESAVFKERLERQKMINKLETLLQKNPKTRDVLYNLYLLYQKDGQTTKAEEYLKKAKAVDPLIKY